MTKYSLQNSLLYLLAESSRIRRPQVHTLMEEIGLYRGQQFVLSVLWADEGITHSQLAERLFVKPATITNGLKRMEKAGLIQRRPDRVDQRISRVYLTDQGRAVRADVETVLESFEQRMLVDFTIEERQLLRKFLLRIRQNLRPEK